MDWNTDTPLQLTPPETQRSNAALNDYALLGTGRSLSQLADLYRSRPDPAPPTRQLTTLKQWSVAYDWQARIACYQEQEQERARAAVEALWTQRRVSEREDTFALGQQLKQRAREMLQFPLATMEQRTNRRELEDGRTIVEQVTVLHPARWSLRDIAAFIKVGTELERLALGLATEHSAVDVSFSVALTTEQLDQLQPDELETLAAYLDLPVPQRAGSPLHVAVQALLGKVGRAG